MPVVAPVRLGRAADPPTPPARRVTRGAVDVLVVVLTLAIVFVAYGHVDNRWYRVVTVDGISMQPTLEPADLIVITRPSDEPQVGDIVTMEVNEHLVTHRIVDIRSDGSIVTQGDNNNVEDRFGDHEIRVVGRYLFRVPRLGGLLRRLPGG